MTLITPSDTAHFTCFRVSPFPTARVPRGCSVRLFPDPYFRVWSKKELSADVRVYTSTGFSRLVLPTLEPVTVTHDAVRTAVYCWRPIVGVPVTWKDVYLHFPTHGPNSNRHQVVPWEHLQDMIYGWGGVQAVVPRNDRGALVMMGDAGVQKTNVSGSITTGKTRFLVQASFYASIGPATWVLGLPEKEMSDDLVPADMTLLTIQ